MADISIHTPREGSDQQDCNTKYNTKYFNPHSPRGERLFKINPPIVFENISIHTPREGSDLILIFVFIQLMLFQSTLPARGATKILLPVPLPSTFQSTLPARGATGERFPMSYLDNYFNPHSPRGERHEGYDVITRSDYISIHTPREGSDHMQSCKNKPDHAFQSTLPARGATRSSNLLHSFGVNFNPHSPRGERPKGQIPTWIRFDFNPHSPRGERPLLPAQLRQATQFQSTLPARGATFCLYSMGSLRVISIHTPREGSDPKSGGCSYSADYFNPHSPRGERRQFAYLLGPVTTFQSTLPARGATSG